MPPKSMSDPSDFTPVDSTTINLTDPFFQFWRQGHAFISLQQQKQDWYSSCWSLTPYVGLAILVIFVRRQLVARTQVTWYHATPTVKLKSKQHGEIQLSKLCQSAAPSCSLNPLLQNSHLQTIWSLYDNRKFPLFFRRAVFKSDDPSYEGSFGMDVAVARLTQQDPSLPPRTAYFDDESLRQVASDDSRPMIVALHGLCGGSHEKYLQHVIAPLIVGQTKWEACVILSRGCGESSITGSGMYTANATSDVRQAVQWLRDKFPNRPLYAVGFSMGANILTRYIAEEAEECVFKAAVVVSNPWNLEVTALHLQRTFWGRWLYSPAMTSGLMNIFSRNAKKVATVNGTPLDMEQTNRVRLMHEYDRYIQCPTWGFPTERVYYRQASSSDSVLEVRIPFWAINATDDPIVGDESIPKGEFEVSPYTVLCTTDGGGHLGWFQSDGRRWYARAIVSFLQEMHSTC